MSARRPFLFFVSLMLLSGPAFAFTLPNGEEIDELTGSDKWGCEVLLCLSNPNGPRAVPECRPPIDRLFKCLAKRHPCKFPKCPRAGNGNRAKQINDHYDPCELLGEGFKEAPIGFLAQTYVRAKVSNSGLNKYEKRKAEKKGYWDVRYNLNGIDKSASQDGGESFPASKACVKGTPKKIKEPIECSSDESGDCYRTIYAYDDLIWQEKQSSRAIDIYIDGKIFRRVHW